MHEILEQSEKIRVQLQLECIVVVFDQAIYAKACEIVWKHPKKFSNIVLRMGAFHTIGVLLRLIGMRFADAGMKDILVESSIVSAGSIDGVINGSSYNRAVRANKLLFEIMMRLIFSSFPEWALNNGVDIILIEDLTRK